MSSSSYHSIYSPPCFYRIYSKELSGHAVPIICPLCLSGNCFIDIHPDDDTKTSLFKVTNDLHIAKSNSWVSGLTFLEVSAALGTAEQPPISAHLRPPQGAEHASQGLCGSHWPFSQPFYYRSSLPDHEMLECPGPCPRTPLFLGTSVYPGYIICRTQ